MVTLIPSIQHLRSDVPAETDYFWQDGGEGSDFALFALWEGALEKQDEILRDISKNFTVLSDQLVFWTTEHYTRNLERLYERTGRSTSFHGFETKIGRPPFRMVVVKDSSPKYTWKQSISGLIEPSNERVVEAKSRYRALFKKPYQVHSSNNWQEFLFQGALILGKSGLDEVLSSPKKITGEIHKDLEGADGWKNWEDLFSVINISCKYVVLRNFESLPERLDDEDIDFLTDNFQRFASAANVFQTEKYPYKGTMSVAGVKIPTDIRFLGDNYFPALWQRSLLDRRILTSGLFVPVEDDYFFSLFFHCKVHKFEVKPKYVERLGGMANRMGFDWFKTEDLASDARSGTLLAGFLRAIRNYYIDPLDPGVGRNWQVVKLLPSLDRLSSLEKWHRVRKIKGLVVAGVTKPSKILPFLSRQLRRR